MNDTPLQIAIDGPVASGKGDIAARLAKELNLLYIYTGAMYRALALACIQTGISCKDAVAVKNILRTVRIDIVQPNPTDEYPYKIVLNGNDITVRITKQDAAQGASDVGTLPFVRQWMVAGQQMLADGKAVVMEGRDIGLRVLPHASLKIYLTASQEERAKRRFREWQQRGIIKTFEETLKDTKARDLQDTTREVDPLQKLPDAWELDCTNLTQIQVVDTIKRELKKRNLL